MAVPDLTAYTDLTLFDRDATDLANRAYSDVITRVPGLQLLAGNIETTLIDVFALTVSEAVYAINRIPNATLAGLLTFMGATPDAGAPPTATVLFNLNTTAVTTIPEGTVVRYTTSTDTLTLVTTAAVANTAGANTVTAPAAATAVGSVWNGVPSGTVLDLQSPIAAVDTTALATGVTGGRDPEDTSAWLARASNRLRRLTSALVTADTFTAYALEQPTVAQAKAVDRWDATTGLHTPGHVTVAVIGAGGTLLTTAELAALRDQMADLAAVNLSVHVANATVTPVDVSAVLELRPGYDPDLVSQDAVASLAAFLDPNTWPFDSTVEVADLVGELNRTAGVQSAVVSVPAADLTLTGFAPLATLGVATITFAS